MLRLYPLAVRGLLRLSARGTGATSFVAMSRAARSSLTGVLPAFALVLALSLATFAGMTSNGITQRRDRRLLAHHRRRRPHRRGAYSPPVSPAAVQAIAAVRGVRHATAVWSTNWVTPFGQPRHGSRGRPGRLRGRWSRARRSRPSRRAKIGTARGRGHVLGRRRCRCCASPAAAAILGTGATQLTTLTAMGPFKVRVAGTLSEHSGRAGRRRVRGHAAGDPARTGRPAAPHHGPGHRLGASTTPSSPPWPRR